MKVKIRRSGSVFIGATIFLGVAAANTGNNLLYILVSSMLALMLISGLSSILNIRGIEVKLIPPLEVFAGRRSRFRVILRKRNKIPSFLIKVTSGFEECLFSIVEGKEGVGLLYLLFPKRGYVESVSVRLSSDFPLGMFVRYMDVEVKLGLVVFPEPIPADLPFLNTKVQREGSSQRKALRKGYEELKGVKEYSGEPMKLIHWKLTAKKGEMLVKEMLEEEREPVILSLESVEGDIETKISKLAYLTVKLIENGYPVGLKLGEKEIPPERGEHQKLAILRELALY